MLEVVPEDVYAQCQLSSFEIVYKKEATYGSSIQSQCTAEQLSALSQPGFSYKHVILGEGEDQELARAKTSWVRRK